MLRGIIIRILGYSAQEATAGGPYAYTVVETCYEVWPAEVIVSMCTGCMRPYPFWVDSLLAFHRHCRPLTSERNCKVSDGELCRCCVCARDYFTPAPH